MARFTQGGGSVDGSALNYVQVAGTQVTVSSAPATIINLDITTTGKPVQISVTGEGSNASAGSWVRMNLFRGNAAIGNEIQIEASDVSENVPYAINFIDDVAAGTYNYSARITSKASGNWQFGEVAGPVINAVELTGFKGDTGAQGEPGADGADGSAGLVYLGDYVSGNGYIADIAVVKGSDDNLYIAKSSGGLLSPVANPGQWDLFLPKGATGPGFYWSGSFDPGTTYPLNYVVSYEGSSYIKVLNEAVGDFPLPTDTTYWSLMVGGATGSADLVIPFIMKDENGNDLLGFEKGGTGVTRINALQDDLALRSSNDIILYPGDDGPGHVYIGWGDATYTPDATNRVATIGDLNTAPKTWTASNDVQYGIYQAHGGLEVTTEDQVYETYSAIGYGNQTNSTSFPLVIPDANLNDMLTSVINGSLHLRKITILVGGIERVITPNYSPGAGPQGWTWYFNSVSPINISDETSYTLNITYGSPPVLWWDAVDLGFDMANDDFRGAKIEYHAYIPDGGTMIGTIYIASDSGDTNVTHIETGSGGNDLGTASWWYRKDGWQEEERRLYFYRTDGEAYTHKIQWTAQVYYASEYRD